MVKRVASGSVIQPVFDVEGSLEAIYAELRGIESVKALLDHPGWLKVQEVLLNRVAQLDRAVIAQAQQPEKNANALIWGSATRYALLGLISIVEAPLADEGNLIEAIEKRVKILQETTGLPRASSLETTQMVDSASRI